MIPPGGLFFRAFPGKGAYCGTKRGPAQKVREEKRVVTTKNTKMEKIGSPQRHGGHRGKQKELLVVMYLPWFLC
jgi:hypothetical protein